MEERSRDWAYANNWLAVATFLGLAIAFLGIGLLVVFAFGDEAGLAGVALLTIATFLLVFSVLVFLPRLARRGSVSFSLFSRRSIEEAERAVRDVLEAAGRAPRVEIVRSRSALPPRIVQAEGIPARFRIEAVRYGTRTAEADTWTEIVLSVTSADRESAEMLRTQIATRLAGPTPPPG